MNLCKNIKSCFVFVAFFAILAYSENDESMQKAFIKTMVGTVEINPGNTGKWRAARAGMVVKMGWNIRTYIESSADIEFETGTILRLGENSVVTLSKMTSDKQADVTKSEVKLSTGKIWANVKKLTNTKSQFEFETPTAVASIRGTRLGLAVDKEGTQLDVYEGLVMVRPRGGAGKDVAVSTRNRAIIGDAGHAIRLVQMAEKDSVKNQVPMKDPFTDTSKTKDKEKMHDTTAKSAVDSSLSTSVSLSVLQPTSGVIIKESSVLVKGKTTAGATVDIGGKEVAVDKDGNFSLLAELNSGKNTITVIARKGSSSKTVDCTVEYRPQLTLNVTNIIDNMVISASDITIDVEVSDGAKYSINGKEGATKVSLSPGKNVVAIRAWDAWNTTMEKSFVINYTKATSFSLIVSTPKDQSVVRDPVIPVSGSTTPGAKVWVNNTPVTVNPSGFFTTTIPIPDEAQEYTVHVVSRLGDDEATEERSVSYSPPKTPLSLSITSPTDGQVIRQNVLRVMGKATPRARVTVNSRPAVVASTGSFTCDIQFLEKDIGDYTLEIAATDDSTDLIKLLKVKVDITSPQINTTIPVLQVPVLGKMVATKQQKVLVNVFDKTPDDQITLFVENNGSREEMLFEPGDQQYFNLEEGKNTFNIKAYDKAKNMSNVAQGVLYYLPGPLSIDLIEPSDNVMSIDDLPPMPKGYRGPKMNVQVEINDGIRTVPETIRYVKITDNTGRMTQMLDQKNYRYSIDVPLIRGTNSFVVSVEDIADNVGTKKFDVIIR